MFRIVTNSSLNSTFKARVVPQASHLNFTTTTSSANSSTTSAAVAAHAAKNFNFNSKRFNSPYQNNNNNNNNNSNNNNNHSNNNHSNNNNNNNNNNHSNNNNNNNQVSYNTQNHNNNNNRNNRSNRKKFYNNSSNNNNNFNNFIPNGRDNPWFHQLVAFEESVSQSSKASRFNSAFDPIFWNSIGKAMSLYRELSGTPDFGAERVSKLVYLLHTGLRQNRSQTLRLDKKPDFDSKSFHKDMSDFLCTSLREVSNDIIDNKISINEYGAMHLITSFKELVLYEEAISIWFSSRNSNSSSVFLDPRVVGVVLPIMYENGHSFENINKLFEQSKATIDYYHPNLAVGMIRTCLLANEINQALRLFEELCANAQQKRFGYLTETHLSFIGESNDLNVANTFFEKALNDEMPYKVDLQAPYIKKFMSNTWSQTKDFDKVLNIWIKCWGNYGINVNKGVSSSINDLFLSIFFENYANDSNIGFLKLKDIIRIYNNIKPVDEPFLNIIMTKCAIWDDSSIIESINDAYQIYGAEKTVVAYRVYLKTLGHSNVSEDHIFNAWNSLLQFADLTGATFIHNADWAALRDATIASKDYSKSRIETYCKIIKLYSVYCRDLRQFNMITEVNGTKHPGILPYLHNLNSLDVFGIKIPNFTNFKQLSS
ncbi:uncharacterized protein ASCRUDRAFT_77977 [Ascoidea rubescens DSM 1968]|uniref:Protein RMD9, mitochondrial n=1 Tax=Ascoidea rubescens DSM 1968 TaxID=1344418 RepID=A0A1D2V9C3_9ASCO|nr:hypothetical protein ASCRUDRAFT_77977 [Ascoidea rubescens DSM 1968]ODV58271.1 hypothetical protein ASCRUDRAFT_77977 [Ascoidea rubescens DSM 1968]